MAVSGHTTGSTFARYNITSATDLLNAAQKLGEYVGGLPRERAANLAEFK